MVISLTVTNPKGESLELELTRPERSGLIVQNVEGLGPTKADINTAELATMDGSLFNSAKTEQRNIVLTLAMLHAPTIEDARLLTYRFFPVKKKIRLRIVTDRRVVYTYGYVESNEPNIFSRTETAQISIICPDPYFYDERQTSVGFYSVEPLFEFPFVNDSTSDALIEISRLRLDSRANLIYSGDADVGALIILHMNGSAKNIGLYNIGTGEQLTIDTDKIQAITGYALKDQDEIYISTVKGDLYVRLLRNGVYENIISAVGKNSDFFQLTSGDNIFAFSAEEGVENIVVMFRYHNAYGGV